MANEWTFDVPRKQHAVFYFGSTGGSKRYNFIQVWIGTHLDRWFGIIPSSPWLSSIAPTNSPVSYTLKAFAQIHGTNNATQSTIEAHQVSGGGSSGDKEWVLNIHGDEGTQLQVSLVISPNLQGGREMQGDGRLIYEGDNAK